MINALTIDVEDYYSVFARDRLAIDRPPSDAVVRNTYRLLQMLAERGVHATFFILGEVAAEFPKLPRMIADAGHEIGVHGFSHRQLFRMTPPEFRQEIFDARKRIEDAAGVATAGHRAPAFSIGPDTRWGLDVLAELGFRYDSSVFPFAGKRYGWPGFRGDIHRVELGGGRSIIECPLSTISVLGKTLPVCGGGYLRHLPMWFTHYAMRKIQRSRPAIVYMHPYEIDTEGGPEFFSQALANSPANVQKFHRDQLKKRQTVAGKLESLLSRYKFAPLRDVIETTINM
ncbi:MAG: DUF3473 domain-containing protein [Planctomycetaceae bacterium]|nr:MAG: DUF3473 domain-containing protein [Planctomycetaceae bacterium]